MSKTKKIMDCFWKKFINSNASMKGPALRGFFNRFSCDVGFNLKAYSPKEYYDNKAKWLSLLSKYEYSSNELLKNWASHDDITRQTTVWNKRITYK